MNFFKNHKTFFITTILLSVLGFIFITAVVRAADFTPAVDVEGVMNGLKNTATESGIKNFDITTRVGKYIGYLLQGLAALMLGLVIFAGVQWMIARDEEENVRKAKDLLRNAAIGFVIVLIAFLLTQLIWGSIFKVVTNNNETAEMPSDSTVNQDNSSVRCAGSELDGRAGEYFCAESCHSDVVEVKNDATKDIGCENIGMKNNKVCCFEFAE